MEHATIIGIDLAKSSFQVHGAGPAGSVAFRKKLSRAKVLDFVASQPRCVVAMEACASARHWGLAFGELGHEVKLVPPVYVKPFVKRQKNEQRENTRLREDLTCTERDRDRWKRRRGQLQQQLDAALRAGFRQAPPFSKDRRQGWGERPGRCAGAQYGRQRPAQVDETHQERVPTRCPDCCAAVKVDRVTPQYQEDPPVVRRPVRRFDIEVGHYSDCRRRVQGRQAPQTSNAPGAASMQLGAEVVAPVVHLHTQLGTQLAKVTDLPGTRFSAHVTL